MGKVILLVEDNPDDEALALRALKKGNVVDGLVVVRDGAEALDYLFATGGHTGRDTSVLPAIILLDLKLPKIDGLEVLRRLRADERTCCLPVVVLTSSKEDPDLIQAYRLGCNSYIRKPVDFTQFVEAVRLVGENVSPVLRHSRPKKKRHPNGMCGKPAADCGAAPRGLRGRLQNQPRRRTASRTKPERSRST